MTSRSEPQPFGWPSSYVPNFSDWLPGDIVLVERDRGVMGRGLYAAQRFAIRRMSRRGARWTHAGLYVGGGEIVEAVPGHGVIQTPVWQYCKSRSLLVRRLSSPFTSADGQAAAAEAMAKIGSKYSMWAVVQSKLIPQTYPKKDALYCSTFVSLVIEASTGYSLHGNPRFLPLHPAVLSGHPDLIDVHAEWRHAI